jgi:hypothetical protein
VAIFTSKANGNWGSSGQTTWNEAGVPSSGDNVLIYAHTIHVASPCFTGPLVVSGALIIDTGYSLLAYGDIILNNATLTVSAGAILGFNDNFTGTVLKLQIGAADGQSSKLLCPGDPNTGRCTVYGSSVGGTNARITDGGFSGGGQVDATYTDFSKLGSYSLPALEFTANGTASLFRLQTSCTLDSCGTIKSNGFPASDATILLDGVTTSSPLAPFDYDFSLYIQGTTRTITGCCFAGRGKQSSQNNLAIINTIFGGGFEETEQDLGAMRTMDTCLILGSGSTTFADVTHCYVLLAAGDNPQGLTVIGPSSITDTSFDGAGTSNNGDCLISGTQYTGYTYIAKRNLVLPNAGGNSAAFINTLEATSGDNTTWTVEHNTFFVNSNGAGGVHLDGVYPGHAGFFGSIKSNLAYSTNGVGAIITSANASAVIDGVVTAADYNGRTAMTTSYELATAKFGSTPGTHDVIGSAPGFVDGTRNIRTWDLSLGGPGTVAHAVSELRLRNDTTGLYNGAYTIGALITYVKAGFVPTNTQYRAAHDATVGGWMGAIAGGTTGPTGAGGGCGPILHWGERTF